MKERQALFSAPMVRAILEGWKTQTRRVVKPQPVKFVESVYRPFQNEPNNWQGFGGGTAGNSGQIYWYGKCPYGQPGDRLWVRETCRAEELEYAGWEDGVRYLADNHWSAIDNTAEAAEKWHDLACYGMKKSGMPECRTVPAIHMPRWASRIQLEITNVRVERLRDITVSDAIAEGYDGSNPSPIDPSIKWYAELWESINGPGSWDANPWVWVIEFKVLKP